MENQDAAVVEAAAAPTNNSNVVDAGATATGDIQQQLLNTQNQNFAVMSTLAKLLEERHMSPHSTLVKKVQMPVGTYTMTLSEIRSFKKDVTDYKQLNPQYSDQSYRH